MYGDLHRRCSGVHISVRRSEIFALQAHWTRHPVERGAGQTGILQQWAAAAWLVNFHLNRPVTAEHPLTADRAWNGGQVRPPQGQARTELSTLGGWMMMRRE